MINKIKLAISPYIYDGIEEFTYEIRGLNIYYSEVGFESYNNAENIGKIKLKEMLHKQLNYLSKYHYKGYEYYWDYDDVDNIEKYWYINDYEWLCFKTELMFKEFIDKLI